MKRVLLVNDDGFTSPGLRALFPVLSREFDLTIVAPATQKSWIGKASSYQQHIQYEKVDVDGYSVYALNGTPSDCASAGIYHICDEKPDLVISGINVGANVGDSYILSSGTVGGAIEAALADITSIAVGVEFGPAQTRKIEFTPGKEDTSLFSFAAAQTCALAKVLSASPSASSVPPGVIFNLNMGMEAGPLSEIVFTRPARYAYDSFLRPSESLESGFYHRGAPKNMDLAEAGTDMAALREGKVSITPLSLLSQAELGGTEEQKLLDSIKALV